MRWISVALIGLTIVLFWGCSGGGGETKGIFGQVISKGTRQPIANATVSLQQNGNEIASVQTDSNGRFAFPNLPSGTYTIVVSSTSYWDTQIRVTFARDQRLSVTIEMISEQEGPPADVPIAD
ncbi:MAG: carboxypeptidase-like regulatory domain-containing protein [Armatimonadetes bacterium]|nr:carboxypeptidase-like regulatory domain-containing protein [Armatimonadota bacterium]MDW8027943.1 carboxypeptidase-like regulatory domain-containing protein [Armatimonadota bacterium]